MRNTHKGCIFVLYPGSFNLSPTMREGGLITPYLMSGYRYAVKNYGKA